MNQHQSHYSVLYWLNLSIILALLLAPLSGAAQAEPVSPSTPPTEATPQTPPSLSTSAAPAQALPGPACALLDNPTARGMMSGALETALLHACGRETEPAIAAPAAPTTVHPQVITALGDNVLVNDPAGELTSMTQSGAVVAFNADTGVLCAAYNDSYHGIVQGTGYTGFSSSSDGGVTWADHGSLNDANSFGYPALAWRRANGHFYLATLYTGGLGMWDLGAGCSAATWVGMVHTGGADDKEMLAADNDPASPYYGRLYAVWTDFADGHIYAARTSDGGQTWSAGVDVSGHNQVNGAWPAVDPVTGDVYVAWTHWDVWLDGPIDVEMARSTDGGATWNPLANPMSDEINPRDVTATTNCGRPALNGDIRYYPYPQIAVDQNGVLHAIYSYDPDGYDYGDIVNIYYRRSTDQGASWKPEIQVNDNWNTTDQFFPALAVGETGIIGVFWYDRRQDDTNNLLYDRYMAMSRDGGLSFEANQRVSDESSPVVHDAALATCFHGDYDAAAAGGGHFYTVWGDDRRGDSDVWSDTEPYFWGSLSGTVYDANTLHGLPDAWVEAVHSPTGMPFSTAGDVGGYYTLNVPGDEIYTVTAQAYGYAPNSVATLVDADGGRADIPLTAVPSWRINGALFDANTGYPVRAHITVSGDPLNPPAPYNETWSDPATGFYTLTHLAAAIPYTLTIEATGYISRVYFAGELDANLTNPDLTLQPDLVACTAPGYELVPPCQVAIGAILQPAYIEVKGCPCADQTHELTFVNHTGANEEVLLSYAASAGATVLDIPATLGLVPNNATHPFDVQIQIDKGVLPDATVYVTVTAYLASNPAISDTTVIEKSALSATEWEARNNSPSVSMDGAVIEYGGKLYNVGGYGSGGAVDIYDPATGSWTTGASEPTPNIDFPTDACFGYAAPNDPVILLLPDTTSGVSGVWHRYHIVSDTWDLPALPAALPANGIWSPDIIVDYVNNMCYITGGATTAGGGNLTTLYRYNPANNTAANLGNFTHIPAGFDFHAGWYAPWIGASGGVCVGGGVDSSSVAYADTQCYDIAAAAFNPANADLGPLPQAWWGMADMEKMHVGDPQLWLADGVNAGGALLQRSAYFSREIDKFVYGPDPLYVVYRVEGDTAQNNVYVVDGAAGGSSASTLHEQLIQCPDCPAPCSVTKAGPDWAYTGDVVPYTLTLTLTPWLTGTVRLADELPAGVDYAGGLNATYGTAWYSPTARSIYWTPPATMLVKRGADVALPQPASPVNIQPASPIASLSELPRPLSLLAPEATGDVIETFTNTWALSTIGLIYNPESDFVRYAHEGGYGIFDVNYSVPHPVLHNFKLSAVNPGWPASLNNRDGVGYDYATGYYFLPDFLGNGGTRNDHIVEIDPSGRIINAWETYGASNDSYDGSMINSIIDIAVVPGAPTRYFATAYGDGNQLYEIDLIKAGQFITDTWGKVMTCTVPGIGDTAGIDYDAQNGVLYHSDFNSANIVVTDLVCNVLDSFICGASSFNSGVTFVEGKWPPEAWVTDYSSNATSRCEAVGRQPLPETVAVTFNVAVTAPSSTTVVNAATLKYTSPGYLPSPSILHLRTTDTAASVQRALNELGYTYDNIYAYSDWTGIDFTPYDVVIIGMTGGLMDIADIQKIRAEVIDRGKRVIFVGGSYYASFVNGVNQYLVANDTANYSWEYSASPHFTLVDPAHPLAQGLPTTRDLVDINATRYQLRVTDPAIEAVAQNGDGHTSYFYKTYPGGGELVWFIHSARGSYWTDPSDFQLLQRIIGNAMPREREAIAEHSFHVAPRPAITWTKEIYVNGAYVGRYDEGPFTVVPGDDVQIVDRLGYVGREPLFVRLTEDWSDYPVEMVDETHIRGLVTSSDGDWSVTLLPGDYTQIAKTLHITEPVPVTIYEWLYPDGMPMEERAIVLQPPVFTKGSPAVANNGQLITYTVVFSSQHPLVGTLLLTDALPSGVAYAGGLSASYGEAWYDTGDNAIYWRNTPASSLTRRSADAATGSKYDAIGPAPAGPLSIQTHTLSLPFFSSSLAPSDTWFSAAPLPRGTVRYAHAQCPGDPNRFYVISGVAGGTTTANMWRYDADTDAWAALAPIPNAVEGASAVCYQGRLYVAGGGGTNQFYIYDIVQDSWSAGPNLPRAVWGAAIGAWDSRIYLAGGDNDFSIGGQSNEVDIYEIAAGNWYTNGATMPIAANAAGFAQVNEYLYVVGGWGNSSPAQNITATQRYNLAWDYWETGPTFASARSDLVLAATGQYLYAIGGDADGSGVFDATTLVERLDYTAWGSDVWTDITDPLPTALTAYSGGFCTMARSGGEIWSVGGIIPSPWTYTDTNQYRPSEPCLATPTVVTITFQANVTAGSGEHIINTAQMNIHGYTLTDQAQTRVPGGFIYLPLVLRNS